jgi:hypothetical protein
MGFFKSGGLILFIILISSTLFAQGNKGTKETDPSSQKQAETPPTLIVGGYQPAPLDSELVLLAIEEAHKAWVGTDGEWSQAVLLKADSQVVSGKKIRLTYQDLPGYSSAVVYFPLNGGSPKVSWVASP